MLHPFCHLRKSSLIKHPYHLLTQRLKPLHPQYNLIQLIPHLAHHPTATIFQHVTPVLPSQEVLTNQAPLSSSYSAFNTTQPTVQSNSANPTSGTPPMIPLTTGLVHPIAVTVATESSTFHTTSAAAPSVSFNSSIQLPSGEPSVQSTAMCMPSSHYLSDHNYAASSLLV